MEGKLGVGVGVGVGVGLSELPLQVVSGPESCKGTSEKPAVGYEFDCLSRIKNKD